MLAIITELSHYLIVLAIITELSHYLIVLAIITELSHYFTLPAIITELSHYLTVLAIITELSHYCTLPAIITELSHYLTVLAIITELSHYTLVLFVIGVSVAPGQASYLQVEEMRYTRLEAPFSSNCTRDTQLPGGWDYRYALYVYSPVGLKHHTQIHLSTDQLIITLYEAS